jgi:hypothetical protein
MNPPFKLGWCVQAVVCCVHLLHWANTSERYNNHDSTQFHQQRPNPAGKAHRLRQHGWMEKVDSELALFQEGN